MPNNDQLLEKCIEDALKELGRCGCGVLALGDGYYINADGNFYYKGSRVIETKEPKIKYVVVGENKYGIYN